MPNIAVVLKSEIARISRKEVRGDTQELRKASAQYRSHIAALRRRIEALEREVKRLAKGVKRVAPARGAAAEPEAEADGTPRRFSAKRFAAQRQKLGLSAAEFATLIGVTAQSVYKWEAGKARPRASQLEQIARLRGIGKREAANRLAELQAG